MAKYIVEGLKRLTGEVSLQGAKNAALPILAATLLVDESVIHNCPRLSDVTAAQNILHCLGCKTNLSGNTLTVHNTGDVGHAIPFHLMREMRSSVVFLGAIIAKTGRARISYPGGCELGPRPIDIHLAALEKLGVEITDDHGYLECRVKDRLRGAKITLPFPSVGATENVLLTACMAQGDTEIHNAAREPEITDLADFLNHCGARIQIRGDGRINIEGVASLHNVEHAVIPDRIVAATYLSCAAATRGEILVTNAIPEHIMSCMPIFEEFGCTIRYMDDSIYLKNDKRLSAVKSIRTMPYPGFPTDAQSPVMSLACVADGTSVFVENIFENRYKHASELTRMGARISVEGRVAVVEGVAELHGATVCCTDLRGGAALVVAALAAEGESHILDIKHVERGYEDLEGVLGALGARIQKVI